MLKKASKVLSASKRPQVFGMVHFPALPGTPLNKLSIAQISNVVRKEVRQYAEAGVDGIIFENMHDLPYVRSNLIGPEIVASATRLCVDGVNELGEDRSKFLLGVQILAQGNKEGLAVAQSAGLDFIRAECFIFSHVADEGWMDGCAGELLRYRRNIGAEDIAIFTDLKKKHSSHAVTADITLADSAKAGEFFQADGFIVTGHATGEAAVPSDLEEVQRVSKLPVLIGSGVTLENWRSYSHADGFIIGSHFKVNGDWRNEVSVPTVKKFMNSVKNNGQSARNTRNSGSSEYLEY
ncbi:unnamed protein product [Bursaphelenchus xylophilus]|uniref:(pine wood nematode) hypothetical protein n=1 Tax=Bursaphelenchus xylophilus TaxID=6326 RepID=A0A1I7RN36_BURXY|nr:unnamed protein product [Bursaphelenchus xylophilus]CAG9087654.1 unnamed protein product [Bursaphelenchus xylophilus]